MSSLVTRARDVLATPGPHTSRQACWLARSALEDLVIGLNAARGVRATSLSGRAGLACLEALYEDDRELAARANYLWIQLSEACHQHAYALSPTHSEASELVEGVGSLAARLPTG